MTKYLASILLFSVVACTAEQTPGGPNPNPTPSDASKADDSSAVTPHGIYTGSGDISRLELSNGTYRIQIADEISGTSTHTGTFTLTNDYIDLLEDGSHHRLQYAPDLTIPETLLWVRWSTSQPWIELWNEGDDCTSAGCGNGETCTSCFGDNVCMPDGTSC